MMFFRIMSALLLITASVFSLHAAETKTFSTVFEHYEEIRQVLIEDSTEGVASHAAKISATVADLRGSFSASKAGVKTADSEAVRGFLAEIEGRASKVVSATTIEGVRDELAELTKPLVRWHELIEGDRPVVAYCPMVKKAWLQPDEPIGNPYAPYMLRCGEVVQR